MEKIRKRKAVFRVEYEIYSTSEEAHNAMCTQILTEMVVDKQKFHYFDLQGGVADPRSASTAIDAVAKCKSARRLAR